MGLAPTRRPKVRGVLLAVAFALFAAGCATRGPRGPSVFALAPVPAVPAGTDSDADAVLGAFFAANGIDLSPAERADILPPGVVQGRIDRVALLRAARMRNRIAVTVKADPDGLRDAFERNVPLLLYLPGGRHGSIKLAMPVDWDCEAGRMHLLAGIGPLLEIPEERFFGMRNNLSNAALCLATPRGLGRLPVPGPERLRLLADFRFAQGSYRRSVALYEQLLENAGTPTMTVHALCGLADSLVRLGKPSRAVLCYRQALELESDSPRLHNNLAYAMLLDGSASAEALSHAETACRLDPSNPIYLETAGALQLALGDCDSATATLERAWSRARNRPPEIQSAICDQLARAWLCAGRRDLALQVVAHRVATWRTPSLPRDLASEFPDLPSPP